MNNETFALLIPLAPFMLGALAIWTRHMRRVETIRATATAETAAQYVAHTERLEERVRVLERIITDRGSNLAHEIEALRFDDGRGDDGLQAAAKKLQ